MKTSKKDGVIALISILVSFLIFGSAFINQPVGKVAAAPKPTRTPAPAGVKKPTATSKPSKNVLYTLTVTTTSPLAGRVTSTPAGIDCGSGGTVCSFSFPAGTQVVLALVPTEGYTFYGWSGDCGNTNICIMDSDKTVSTNFYDARTPTVYPNQPLTVYVNSPTGGLITSNPLGIYCGSGSGGYSVCSFSFEEGINVELIEYPNAGYSFGGWSGDCTGTGQCIITMDAGKTVTATFQ